MIEFIVIEFIMIICGFLLLIRNYQLTRIATSLFLLYVAIIGFSQGIQTSNDLLLRPLGSTTTIMSAYNGALGITGNPIQIGFLIVMFFGALAIAFSDLS